MDIAPQLIDYALNSASPKEKTINFCLVRHCFERFYCHGLLLWIAIEMAVQFRVIFVLHSLEDSNMFQVKYYFTSILENRPELFGMLNSKDLITFGFRSVIIFITEFALQCSKSVLLTNTDLHSTVMFIE